jgi:hypothetical protein
MNNELCAICGLPLKNPIWKFERKEDHGDWVMGVTINKIETYITLYACSEFCYNIREMSRLHD